MEETVDTGIREANAADRAEAAEGAEHAPPDAREKTEGEESLETRFDAMIRGEMKELYEQAVRRETERALLAAQQAQQQAAQRAAMVQRLEAEEAQVKEVYPTFDLEKEAGNPEFAALLKRGVSMKQAFEVLHMDELMQGAMQYTAAKVQQTTARNIQARQARPDEGAAAKAAPVTAKTDVNKLTKADREKIAQEVMRGKIITFS